MEDMGNRLYRSQTDRMLGGVCGGLAKYLNIDVTIVRLFFIVFTLLGGIGPLVYIILWIVVDSESAVSTDQSQPLNGEELRERAETMRDEFVSAVRQPNVNAARFIGIALILGGAYLFIRQLNLPWLSWLDNGVVLAGLVVLAGVALLLRATKKE